jgi:hypothetical protein
MIGKHRPADGSARALVLMAVVVLGVFHATPALAQADPGVDRVTLHALGTATDLVLQGPTAEAQLGFPLPAGGISGGQLRLRLVAFADACG